MMRKSIAFILLFLFAFTACSDQPEVIEQPQAEEILVNKVKTISIWLPPYLPEVLAENLKKVDDLVVYDSQSSANLTLDVSSETPVAEWVYVVAAPFPTVEDEISSRELIAFWSGSQADGLPFNELLVEGGTKAILERLWGPASVENVRVVSKNDLLTSAWEKQTSWAIIPFEMVEPGWKVIALDGQSPLEKSFNQSLYPLVVPFSVIGDQAVAADFQSRFGPASTEPVFLQTNRDAGKLATVMVTGVTALVGGTAFLMDRNGITYPSIDIGDLLRDADILHINNEVSFSPSCSSDPFADRANLILCSKPQYIQLLEAIGTDVVELAGDHFIDQSDEAMLNTIDMYDQRGWQYYGGGRDYQDGITPALFEHHGNKIAFIGCNAKTPGYARASATAPGAVHCNLDQMADVVKQVKADGYQPIFTFQHIEYYAYNINPNLVEDFHRAADAGAVIVSGSQAHMPHGFEFYKGSMLHYGLGNLFFDQYNESQEQRKAFIDEHVFYENRYIGTRLVTIQFIDWARPRLMTEDERSELLRNVFFASGW
jgi:poly-gamma-glutamate synthesis protein (capsule biosynthesis protein)